MLDKVIFNFSVLCLATTVI